MTISNYAEFMAEAERLDPEGFAKARAERAEMEALRRDAARYRWLRDLLAVEDIHVALMDRWGTPDEAESAKTDALVDSAMADDVAKGAA